MKTRLTAAWVAAALFFSQAGSLLAEPAPPIWVDAEGRVPTSYASYTRENPVRGSLYVQTSYVTAASSARPRVLVMVNTTVFAGISARIQRYVMDLEAEGYAVTLVEGMNGAPNELRAYFQSAYAASREGPMAGVVLVGDWSVPWFEMDNDFHGRAEFPMDLYYQDLDGAWVDRDGDGMLDDHFDGDGSVAPEIWVGRIMSSPLSGDEVFLLNRYFDKNHAYRTGQFDGSQRALTFIDDDWTPFWDFRYGLTYTYGDVKMVTDGAVTVAENYRIELEEPYEFLQVSAHSSAYSHSFKIGSAWSGGRVTNMEIRDLGPESVFYNLFACSSARFIERDNLGAWYIFSTGSGLASVGTTKTGSMLNFVAFYSPFGEGKSLGRAFRDWLANEAPYSLTNRRWYYGMVIQGDPTLRKDQSNANDLVRFTPRTRTQQFSEDTAGCPARYVGTFHFSARLKNVGIRELSSIAIQVSDLTNRNRLLTPAGLLQAGDEFRVQPAGRYRYAEGRYALPPGRYVDVPLTVCLRNRKPFSLRVDVAANSPR